MTDKTRETLGFQTEIKQLLDLMVHSLYSNKEIFLRELISNASDANDKLRFEALSDDGLYEGDAELKIRIDYDNNKRTISVSDNGIGMFRDEVIDNIGTIAKSGTVEFFKALTGDARKDSQLIGQFGVGFYSAFIVAKKVVLTTRRAGAPATAGVRWESDGEGEYTIENVEVPQRGTTVELTLRDEEDELLNHWRLSNIIHKYSDHISFPILLPKQNDKGEKEDEFERVNEGTALWIRAKQDISDDDYDAFFKHVAHDSQSPLTRVHSKVEGKLQYTLLLYVPSHAPFDLWDRDGHRGVRLYVKRVFILDDSDQLLPRYLRFIRGIIDTDDLPLNISRELLQRNKTIDAIRGGAVKKILGMIEDLTKDEEKYQQFWDLFGRVLKEGIVEDPGNQERLAKLLRFASTHGEDDKQTVSLANYIERMPAEQKAVYYLSGESFNAVSRSPHLEIFKEKGIEVLLLTDPVDEWLVSHLTEFEGKPLKSVAHGDLDLEVEAGVIEGVGGEKLAERESQQASAALVERLKETLKERVADVRTTQRLTSSPACLVANEHDMSPQLRRILESAGQTVPSQKRTLEINPKHPLVQQLGSLDDETRFADWATLLVDQAVLSEGGKLDDPADFVRRMNELYLAAGGSAG
jgi:molecular chaperone HtpG